ncbi:hypothetical protein EsH8_VII_000472 [Colletotrichum jinshuiense]
MPRRGSEELDPDAAESGRPPDSASSLSPVQTTRPERSPQTLSRTEPGLPSGTDEDSSPPSANTSPRSPTRERDVQYHEDRLADQARIEQEAQEREALWRRGLQPNPQPAQRPSLIIGAPLGRNLTAVEAAARLVAQWEEIHQTTLSETPEGAGPVLEALTRARAQLASMTTQQQQPGTPSSSSAGHENPAATTPLNSLPAYKSAAVASRTRALADALRDSTFPPERANIAAAISLYRAARIPYSASWALIYAGRLVDFAPTYAAFTADRAARLDRYARLHGEGWLWFEPPLAREPGPPFSASARRGTWVPETDTSYDMGHYSVTMSFRRMKDLVYRRGPTAGEEEGEGEEEEKETDWPAIHSDTESDSPLSPTPRAARAFPPPPFAAEAPPVRLRGARASRHPLMARDPAAPTLHFRMLLDSGATLPMLYDRDAAALGIDRAAYAAVSRITVDTASDAAMTTWLYEMQASVADTRSCAPLVSPAAPVWPAEEHALGGIVPVMVRPSPPQGAAAAPSFSAPSGPTGPVAETVGGETTFLRGAASLVDEAEGRDYGRLSGLLPFKCCYVQSTPGLRTLWLGEDRRDVLGAHRMPGQMRWAPGSGRVCDPGQPRGLWEKICGGRGERGHADGGKPVLLRMAHEETVPYDDGEGEGRVRMVDLEEKGWTGRSEVLVVDEAGLRSKHAIEPRSLETQRVKRRRLMD